MKSSASQGVLAAILLVTAYALVYVLALSGGSSADPTATRASSDRIAVRPSTRIAAGAAGAAGAELRGFTVGGAHLPGESSDHGYRPTRFVGEPGGAPRGQSDSAAARAGHVAHALLREASRLEMRSNGVVIHLGTPEQHKYVGEDWGVRRWDAVCENRRLFAEINHHWEISFDDWQGGAVAMRLQARAGEGARIRPMINGKTLKWRDVPTGWDEMEFALPRPSRPGRIKVRFQIRRRSGESTRSRSPGKAQVEWIWFRRGPGAPPPPGRVAVRSFGDPRRALVADGSRTYSYHVLVPRGGVLTFAHGAEGPTKFSVWVGMDGHQRRRLFATTAKPGRWQEATVALGDLAGRVVRLDLTTWGSGPAGWAEPEIRIPGPRTVVKPLTTPQTAKNVVHVLVDAARADMFRPFNPTSKVATPALGQLARDGVVFSKAYANANWTLPSVASILTGRYPFNLGSKGALFKLAPSIPTLAQHLKYHGFNTCALVANRFVTKAFGFGRGWDHHRAFPAENAAETNAAGPKHGAETDGRQLVDEAVRWLAHGRDRSKRFYLYLHTMEPHSPYRRHRGQTDRDLQPPYSGKLSDPVGPDLVQDFNEGRRTLNSEDRRYIRALYRGEVAYHDTLLARVIAELRRQQILDSTLVVFSNDHGEELFDHGKLDHGHSLFEELVRAPLVLRFPRGLGRGRRVERPVELVDLLPTQLELLGLPAMGQTHGRSLRRAMAEVPGVASDYAVTGTMDHAVRMGPYKLIASPDGRSLYDLTTDPGEKVDIASRRPVARRALEIRLREALAVPAKHLRLRTATPRSLDMSTGEELNLNPQLTRQLRALGYLR